MRSLASIAGLISLAVAVRTVSAAPVGAPSLAPARAEEAGTWLPGTTSRLPETVLPPASAERVRQHLEAGDAPRALRDARRWAELAPWGRARDAAWMVVGVLEREAGRWNAASEAFTKVRASDGPLAPLGTFLEAESDLARGRPWATIRECDELVARWPLDEHVPDCRRLRAVAQAQLGLAADARASAEAYDREHPKGPIREQIELHLALRLEKADPERAVPALLDLARDHRAALTGRAAEEALERLGAAGIPGAGIPSDPSWRMARAVSLRDSGRRDAAWAELESLRALGASDPAVARWVAQNEERFEWRCWRWDALATRYARIYEEHPRGDLAWDLYKILVRGSRFAEAAELALEMQAKWPSSPSWRRSQEDVGRTMMIAGRYGDAVAQFDLVAKRGGWSGRRASFLAGFAALLAGRAEEAVSRLDKVVASRGDTEAEARYWRARALDQVGRAEAAAEDRAWIRKRDPWSWYSVLLDQDSPDLPRVTPYAREGGWPGSAEPSPEVAELWLEPPPAAREVLPALLGEVSSHPAVVPAAARPPSPGFAAWSWTPSSAAWAASAAVLSMPSPTPADDPAELPASYRRSPVFDPDQAREELARVAAEQGEDFPELVRIADLASVGLYDLSGTGMSSFYDRLRRSGRSGGAAARSLLASPSSLWKSLFLASRDHHHTARTWFGAWERVDDPALAVEAQRLGYPLAHDRYVWTHSREHDVDPMMVLGLMRQESTYNPVAVSSAGARGAMQIMPRTGHLLADQVHDLTFNAGDLEDPVFAVGYGIRYLGLLMERYEGVFPLAVASYNGGPHNVSSWLGGTGLEVPTDVFVELIPFRETRDYVKKVTAGYAAYVDLYAPEGSAVIVPARPTGNHPDVVDF